MKKNMRKGITLIEIAVVLIIMGLLLSIAFKGFDLLKSSSIVSEAAKIQKITSAIVTFKAKNKRLPGDGCTTNLPTTALCVKPTPDGHIDGTTTDYIEDDAFWIELYVEGLLTEADRFSEIGQQNYVLDPDGEITNAHNGVYLTLTDTAVPERVMCELDRSYGDGDHTPSTTDSLFMSTTTSASYTSATICENVSNTIGAAFLVYKY